MPENWMKSPVTGEVLYNWRGEGRGERVLPEGRRGNTY